MNSRSKSQKIAFVALLVAAVVLIAGGIFGVINRTSDSGEQMLSDMRLTALLTTTGEGSKEALVEAEIEAAREEARAGRVYGDDRGFHPHGGRGRRRGRSARTRGKPDH